MSRSIWATALAACAVALALFAAALVPSVALAAGGSSADSAHSQPHRATVLGPGSGFPTPSRAVRSLQTKLTANGFSPGPVDGRFGPLTKSAVERFQQADGLAVDGIVGRHTRHGLSAGGLLPGAGSIEPTGSRAVKATAAASAALRVLARRGRRPLRASHDGSGDAFPARASPRCQRDRLRGDPPGAREPHPQARAARGPAGQQQPGAREAEGQAQPGSGQAAAGAHSHQPSTRTG